MSGCLIPGGLVYFRANVASSGEQHGGKTVENVEVACVFLNVNLRLDRLSRLPCVRACSHVSCLLLHGRAARCCHAAGALVL